MTVLPGEFQVLVVDNDDSFVYTLCDYLAQLGAAVTVVRGRDLDDGAVHDALSRADAVLISPGPGKPADAGASVAVVQAAARARMPLLGVCLGHQAIAEAFGGVLAVAPELRHGAVSLISHDGTGLFDGLPQPFEAGRYHSLAVVDGTLPAELPVTARTQSGVIMAISHRTLPIDGVQFHPESILTQGGHRMLGNWLTAAGLRRVSPHR